MEGYAELHCHSNFSFLDGASDPEELVKVASSLGLSAIAITDHNGLYAVPRFASAARLCGLPTIYGAELTLEGGTPRDKMIDPIGDHVVVLAKGPKGYSSLSKVISAGHMANTKKGSFELSYEELASANSGDWVVLTGCRKGPIAKALFEQGPTAAKKRLGHLCELFGRDKVFVECWDHADPLDEPRNAEFVKIATSLGVELVATNNVHYATRDSAQLHQVLMAIRSNKPIDEIEGWLPSYPMANLRSPKEQLRRFSRFPTLVQNAHDLGLECAFDLELIAPKLPDFLVPQGYDEMSFLRELTYRMAPARYGPRSSPRIQGAYEQLDYELDIISELGFAGYFLIVWDIVEFCKTNNIFCQGRVAICALLSTWKTPTVSALESISYMQSSCGIRAKSTSRPWNSLTRSTISCNAESIPRPKRSNLTKPTWAQSSLSHWITVRFSILAHSMGHTSEISLSHITIPPTWIPVCRGLFSICKAMSKTPWGAVTTLSPPASLSSKLWTSPGCLST